MFPHYPSVGHEHGDITGLEVSVMSEDETLQLETSEAYVLNVPTSGKAQLVADTVYAALRGIETFSQLVYFNFSSHGYFVPNGPWSVKVRCVVWCCYCIHVASN